MEEFYICVKFETTNKEYYFQTLIPTLKIGDYVVVETIIGKELGVVTKESRPLSSLNFSKEIKPILRKAQPSDLKIHDENKVMAVTASNYFIDLTNELNLNMRLISSEYTLDRTKILFTYSSDDRIDFRELLKMLAAKLHCRIELRQISSRERAQMIGGVGVCGLPICCTTFFKTFEGISLNRAKNQMLSINIPKLSGLCGKLMCCLKYEDDQYTELKKNFPAIGSPITYNNDKYKVSGYNVFTQIIKIENEDNVEFVPLKELKKKDRIKNEK
ncbi:MAG: regulatory iron-sulfur-containing complex subunit RicT [Candidatus Onthovivens sp.]|nr:regulatory iron-sulfur-containing complex subunit RicT [Candidatus Onthovivens sp.]